MSITTENKKVCVVGAGALGMTAALKLARRGFDVTLIERAAGLGGLADSWRVGDITWDRHYHVTLLSDAHTRKLAEEIGIGDQFDWRETRTGFYSSSKLYSMSNSVEFLKFPPLRFLDKIRLGFTIFYCARIRNWRRLEKITVADWLTRWSGKRTFESMWLPLLKSKLGDNYTDTSAAFIWATINRMYAARRSGLKKEMFGYVRGGYATFNDALGLALEKAGVRVQTATAVQSVVSSGNQTLVNTQTRNGAAEQTAFDHVVMTVQTPVIAGLVPELNDLEKRQLTDIRYMGVVCASVLLKKPLGGYYVTNITDPGFPFTGVIEMTALVDADQVDNRHLVYLPKYVSSDDALLKASDEEIQDSFLQGLFRMYPDLDETDVEAFRISRVSHVMALPTIDYSTKVPDVATSMPGVSIITSAQIVNGTLNVNETIALAERSLPTVIDRIGTPQLHNNDEEAHELSATG